MVGPMPGTDWSRLSCARHTGLSCTVVRSSVVVALRRCSRKWMWVWTSCLTRPRASEQPVPFRGQHLDELPAAGDQRGQLLLRGIRERPRLGTDVGGKPRQDVGIQGVGLREAPDRFGKVADLARIDDGDRQAGQRHRRRDIRLIAAGRLQDDQRGGQRPEVRDQRTQPGLIVREPHRRGGGRGGEVEMRLRDIQTDVTRSRHGRAPRRTRPTLPDAGSTPRAPVRALAATAERHALATHGLSTLGRLRAMALGERHQDTRAALQSRLEAELKLRPTANRKPLSVASRKLVVHRGRRGARLARREEHIGRYVSDEHRRQADASPAECQRTSRH